MIVWAFPGQGVQRKGMGAGLFERYPRHCAEADEILGYGLRELCLQNEDGRLRDTRYAQPAMFAVGMLTYLAARDDGAAPPDYLAGHSLGELCALCAAGCFDFADGLRLVRRRGELMSAVGGGMLAVVGLTAGELAEALAAEGCADVDLANHNAVRQAVLSGPLSSLNQLGAALRGRPGVRCVPLNVSAPFHSRAMAGAAREFGSFLQAFSFADPVVPVVANVTARPYGPGEVAELLSRQIAQPVAWYDTLRYLRSRGVDELREIGPGRVLAGLWQQALDEPAPAPEPEPEPELDLTPRPAREPASVSARTPAQQLGSAEFRRDYRVRYAYLSGSMYQGIASVAMVLRMAGAGLLGFFGTGGVPPAEVERVLAELRGALGAGGQYGMNLLADPDEPQADQHTVAQYLAAGVRYAEAAGYLAVTPALVRFRFSGCARDTDGRPRAVRHLVAKVSRPEVAAAFLAPPPEAMLGRLVADGALTAAEAETARHLPVAGDLCVESDSGGHTDGGVAFALMPVMTRLRDEAMARHRFAERIRVGASGGLGSPEAVAAAFVLGADFVVTGSVNQCSVEAGTSPEVKELLAGLDVPDTTYAPAGDMFELGARVQVVRKGTLFPARANKLFQLYRQYGSWEEIDEPTRRSVEQTVFRRSFEEVWKETREHYLDTGRPGSVERAERDPRHKLASVFRWYFAYSGRLALSGAAGERANFQVHCGPAMGAFNHVVRGTPMEDWRARHVDEIAETLMSGAAGVLGRLTRPADPSDPSDPCPARPAATKEIRR